MSDGPAEGDPTFRRHHLLALLPLFALVGAPYIANSIEPRILGMPFLLAWIVIWVLLTSVVMAIILKLDGAATESTQIDRGEIDRANVDGATLDIVERR